jgi:hypothetical protein
MLPVMSLEALVPEHRLRNNIQSNPVPLRTLIMSHCSTYLLQTLQKPQVIILL